MKILMVTGFYPPHIGGVEIVFKELSERLASSGHEVKVITQKFAEHEPTRTSTASKVLGISSSPEIIGIKVPNFLHRYWFTFASIPKVLKYAAWADVIQTTTFNSALPAWISSKIRRKPCVLMVHEVWIDKWRKILRVGKASSLILSTIERIILSLPFDKYVAVSQATADDLARHGINRSKIEVIHHGIDYEIFHPATSPQDIEFIAKKRAELDLDKKFVYTFFGRPGVSKGMEHLVDAIPSIVTSAPDATFLFISSPDMQNRKRWDALMKKIATSGISKFIKIIPPVAREQLPNYMRLSDTVVVPSLTEGFGFCAAEASACGARVAVSETGSLTEVTSGEVVFFKPGNSSSIAEALINMHNGKWKKVPEKKFDWGVAVKKYEAIYKNLI